MFAWGRDICEESMSVYVKGMRITCYSRHGGGRERGSDCLAEKAIGSTFWLGDMRSVSSNEMQMYSRWSQLLDAQAREPVTPIDRLLE